MINQSIQALALLSLNLILVILLSLALCCLRADGDGEEVETHRLTSDEIATALKLSAKRKQQNDGSAPILD